MSTYTIEPLRRAARRALMLRFFPAVVCAAFALQGSASPAKNTFSAEKASSCALSATDTPSAFLRQPLPADTVRPFSDEARRCADSLEISRLREQVQALEHALRIPPDSLRSPHVSARYVRHRRHVAEGWMRVVPNQVTLQYAGSIGLASAGIGWHYGRARHWETELLVGFVPRYHARHAHSTFTLKQRYVPWHCRISSRWTFQPLTAGLFFNTISGSEFWRREPDKYPKSYYGFSSKIRTNVFLGERIRYAVPSRRRVLHSAVSAYYELSSCDLYIVSKATNKSYPWSRTLSLAFGLCWEL